MIIRRESIISDYHNVMAHCMECIFKSGILLNEHDELLTQFWGPYYNYNNTKHIKPYLLSASILTGLIIGYCKTSILYVAILVMPSGIVLSLDILKRYKWKRYKKEFALFINESQEIYALNKRIIHHYQMHKVAVNNLGESTKQLIEDVILKRMLDYLLNIKENMLQLILFLKNILRTIGDIIDLGDLNFIFNIDLNENNFKNNIDNEESILSNFQKIQMAYVYIISTLLCSIGLSFCVNEWKSPNDDFRKLFTKIIPRCLRKSQEIHIVINDHFNLIYNKLPDSISIKNEVKSKTSTSLANTINNLKEYIKLSFNVVNSMQIEMSNNESRIEYYLDDLENLFIQCKDILKALQYRVHKGKSPQVIRDPVKKTIEMKSKDKNEIIVKFDDPEEILKEEEFNLSIHGSDISDDEDDTTNLEYEQLLEYVKSQKLMIRELNDELRKRQMIKQSDFIPIPAKRNKYKVANVIESESEGKSDLVESSKIPPIPPPLPQESKTTLNILEVSIVPQFTNENLNTETDVTTNINPYVTSLESKYNFLAQIRTAATDRGIEETIFGDDMSNSDSSYED